jgi:hypothetical protein
VTGDADPMALATRDEIERYAGAVLAGEKPPRPGSLARTRMRVSFTAPPGVAAYRASGGETGALAIRVSRTSRAALWMWFFAACAVAGIASTWSYRRGEPSGWLIAASIVVGLYALVRTCMLFDRYELTVRDGVLRYDGSRFWPRDSVALPMASVEQLFVTDRSGRFHLEARLRDGTNVPLATHVPHADLAFYFERQLELAMAVLDAPIEGELPRNRPLPERSQAVRALVEIGVIGALVLGAFVGFRAAGVPLATVTLGETEATTTFTIERAGQVFFTTDVELEHSEWSQFSQIPRSMEYRITIAQHGAPVAELSCDPLESTVWSSSQRPHRVTGFEASLDRCTAELPSAGSYTLRALRVDRHGLPRVAATTTLTVREPR